MKMITEDLAFISGGNGEWNVGELAALGIGVVGCIAATMIVCRSIHRTMHEAIIAQSQVLPVISV